VKTGGTLVYSNLVLNANDDTDNDGLPNGYEQSHGYDPLNPAEASLDSDGDGLTNGQEVQLHTDPLDAKSVPRIFEFCERQHRCDSHVPRHPRFSPTRFKRRLERPVTATISTLSVHRFRAAPGVTTGSVFNGGNLVTNQALYYRLRVIVP